MRGIRSRILQRVLRRGGVRSGTPSMIVVGLGNPGSEYARTRHNIGFWCVDRIAADHAIALSRRNRVAVVGEGALGGHRVVLAKPRTFVNRSGRAIDYLRARYGASPEKLLVIYDDIDLPLGRVRLRPDGSAGGHNGMRSIVEALGTQDFPRLRVGIGRPPEGIDQVDYVLGTMSKEEQQQAEEEVGRVAEAVVCVLTEGMSAAMNRFN